MSPERIIQIQEQLQGLQRRLLTLEWDLSKNQINPYKRVEYERLKGEQRSLQEELTGLQSVP